jgi:quercetin dioxygenase-like cupin family protein
MRRRHFLQGALALPMASWADAASNKSFASALLERTRTYCQSLEQGRLEPFLNEWPEPSASRVVAAASLPVLALEPTLAKHCAPRSRALVVELLHISSLLAWHQSYSAASVGQSFLDNYGYAEIAGLSGPIPSERLAVGFLILGPDTFYPRHWHEAEEIYIPLSGTARWLGGDGSWRLQPPGSIIFHARHEPHAMKTLPMSPLLALYLWRSSDLNQKSQLDPQS